MKMGLQIFGALGRPVYGATSILVAVAISLLFLYQDEFYFVSPYLVAYIDPARVGVFILDVVVSALSGIVLVASVYEIRAFPGLRGSYRKTGMAGIVAAFVAGACPCYYLVPLLAALGGMGGVLSALGILLNSYEIPIKLASLGLLGFTAFTLERGLRTACAMPNRV